jgi:hypothetical protein
MKQKDLVKMASECSNLRKMGQPEKVIEITREIVDSKEDYIGKIGFDRILCTRGGAFRDLAEPEKALELAKEAIDANYLYCHPFNLAGAACYNLRLFEDGDYYFDIALKKGENKDRIERLKKISRKQGEAIHKGKETNRKIRLKYSPEEDSIFSDEFDEMNSVNKMIAEDFEDYSDSMARSEENGWFYSDEDEHF